MQRHQCNVSCLPAERRHKFAKQRAESLFKDFGQSLLTLETFNMLARVRDEIDMCSKERMSSLSPVHAEDAVTWDAVVGSALQAPMLRAIEANCGLVAMRRGDMLLWTEAADGERHCVGRCHCFVVDANSQRFAIVQQYAQVNGDLYSSAVSRPRALHLRSIVTPLTYVMVDEHSARVLKPAWL